MVLNVIKILPYILFLLNLFVPNKIASSEQG